MGKLDFCSSMGRKGIINRSKCWLHVSRRRNHVTHGKIKLKTFLALSSPAEHTYMSHLQIVFAIPLGYQSPISSPCCHLPWSISNQWNQSDCIFPRNSSVQMIAVLLGWLAILMYFEPILSVFQWDKLGKCIHIICVIIYDAFICELHLYWGILSR
jgi:hypothetical protein